MRQRFLEQPAILKDVADAGLEVPELADRGHGT
jgi:hypothetical protein